MPQERNRYEVQPDKSLKTVKETRVLPFMVIESLSGKDLIDAQTQLQALNNKELLGVVYQIALAINTAFEYYGFKHYDLHPGNIRMLDERIKQTLNNGIRLDAPRMVIFDFGLARDKDYTAEQASNFAIDNETRLNTQVLKSFVGKFGLSTARFFSNSDSNVEKIAGTKSNNQDVRFFNQIFAAIWTLLKKNNFVDYDFPYCGPTMQDCLDMEIFSKLKS